MRKTLVVVIVVAIACGSSTVANSQIPHVAVFFDPGLQYQQKNCPPAPIGTVLDSVFVVATNFDMWMSAIEYQIIYPPEMLFLGDVTPAGALVIGNSPAGITIAFPTPMNAFTQAVVQKTKFIWMCDACFNPNTPLIVVPHPNSGFLRAVRWPDNVVVNAIGWTSLICATIPVEESTWGQVKALYR